MLRDNRMFRGGKAWRANAAFLLSVAPLSACMAAAGLGMIGHGPILYEGSPVLGVYDPESSFSDVQSVGIEHFFYPWTDGHLDWLRDVDDYAFARGRKMMVTLEPFSWTSEVQEPPEKLRDDILAGGYDHTIDKVCGLLGDLSSPVLIRWGHEMEYRSERYPWSGWDPQDYQDAYRHFVSRCRLGAPDAKFVWSPRGERNLGLYFPGRDYVDYVGLSVYGFQEFDIQHYGKPRDFGEVFGPRYERVRGFDLPIMIAELGYSGDREYVVRWSQQAMRPDARFDNVAAVVYFNAREVAPWPDGLGLPDWRVYSNVRRY